MFVPSVILKRRERRASKYQIFGCLKKLRGTSAKRVAPPEPLTPPPGVVFEAKPKAVGLMVPETFPLKRCPEKALRIGANVQPLKIARPDEDGRAEDLAVEGPARDREVHGAGGLGQVRVHEVRQRVREAEEVGGRDRGVARDLALEYEVSLVNLRQLEVGREVLHGGGHERARGQKVREAGGRRAAGR